MEQHAKLIDFRDEDNMISNSSTSIPSQQSVKAYVDTKVSNLVDMLQEHLIL